MFAQRCGVLNRHRMSFYSARQGAILVVVGNIRDKTRACTQLHASDRRVSMRMVSRKNTGPEHLTPTLHMRLAQACCSSCGWSSHGSSVGRRISQWLAILAMFCCCHVTVVLSGVHTLFVGA